MLKRVWEWRKKALAYALAALMAVGVMQAAPPVRADNASGITFEKSAPKYNIASGTLKVQVTINSNTTIKYYVWNWKTEEINWDEMNDTQKNDKFKSLFEKEAAKVIASDSDSRTVSCGQYETIYVWPVVEDSSAQGGYKPDVEEDNEYPYFPTESDFGDNNYDNGDALLDLLCTKGTDASFYTANLITWNPSVSYDSETGIFTVKSDSLENTTNNNVKLAQRVYFSKSAGNLGIDIQNRTTEDSIVDNGKLKDIEVSINSELDESGYLTCFFWLEEYNSNKIIKRSTVYKCDAIRYTKPQNKLDQVTNIEWSAEKAGTFTFTKLTDQAKVSGYYIRLYRRVSGGGTEQFGQTQWVSTDSSDKAERDISGFMTDANAEYWVGIRTNSNTPLTWGNSDEVFSRRYSPSEASDSLMNAFKTAGIQGSSFGAMKAAVAQKKDDIVTVLKNNKSNVRTAMQVNQDMVELIKAVEGDAKVTATISSSNLSGAIDVVGAKVGTTATKLTVGDASSFNVEDKYQNLVNDASVLLEIKLTDDSNQAVAPVIPVSITMPVPSDLDGDKLVILHMSTQNGNGGLKVEETIYPKYSGGKISFTVTHFSKFVFTESDSKFSAVGGGSSKGSSGSGKVNADPGAVVGTMITSAADGATVKIKGVTTLSNSVMKKLLKRSDVTLVMEYTYKGVDYVITIPAGAAVDNDIPWYGPLYLAEHYGNNKPDADKTATSTYVVKRGDTMRKIARENGMSLAELMAKNPQIKNASRIKVGQTINK